MLIRLLVLALLALALASCGGGGGGGTAAPAPTPSVLCTAPDPCVPLTVDNGPASFTGYNVNRLFTSVTVCKRGTTLCQTIDHVLVDTGSTGLRLLYSVVNPALGLDSVTSTSGQPLLNCVQFVDTTHAFGRVARADVVLGPKSAGDLPIQIIGDPAYSALSAVCASGQTLTTVADLGANGILGVGLREQDCGPYCVSNVNNGYYFSCPSGISCTSTTILQPTASLLQQVANPVPKFSADNNGVVITLPSVPTTGAASVIGQMLFGIGTHTSNMPSGTTLLQTTPQGSIKTAFQGITMTGSFIDSGSNGLYFGTLTMPVCGGKASGFYCPSTPTTFAATLVGTNAIPVPEQFTAINASTLFATGNTALPTLTGPMGNNTSFDWGLPFFYGRRVFVGIEGRSSPVGTGPYYAF